MLKIEFEGTDGAGKSTSIAYFVKKARELGLSVVETREVGNPHIPACVKLREFILDPASNLSGESMELMFAAMRVENEKWLKSLSGVDLVVSDRGWFSHLAYTDHNVSREFTKMLYGDLMTKITSKPNIVVYFDINTETALKRRVKRGTGMDVIEMKGVEFQNKVRDSFEKHMDQESAVTIFTVDANGTFEDVQNQVDTVLSRIARFV